MQNSKWYGAFFRIRELAAFPSGSNSINGWYFAWAKGESKRCRLAVFLLRPFKYNGFSTVSLVTGSIQTASCLKSETVLSPKDNIARERNTNNLEDQFSYIIKAINENGDALFLEVYSASSEPAIGGLNDSDSKSAASELALYIRQAQAIEFE